MSAPWSEHPWVLVEGEGFRAEQVAAIMRSLGYEVNVCAGPDETHPCPLVEGECCRLVEAAEIVVNVLGDRDADGTVAAATRAATGAPLLRIGARGSEEGLVGAERATTPQELAQALQAAIALTERG